MSYAVVALGNEYQEDKAADLWKPEALAVAVHRVFNPYLSVSLGAPTPAPPVVE